MARYHPIKDITTSNARLLEDVEPELAMLNLDHAKSYLPLNATVSKMVTGATAPTTVKKWLSVNFGANLLESTGWGNGTRLPFANKENHDLEKLLEIRQRKYLVIQTELRDNTEHLNMLEENFNRASEDVVAYQNFLTSRKKQIEEEKNLQNLAERFFSKVKQDKQKIEKDLRLCKERCDRMQMNHNGRLKNLYELRDLIEFDREALKEYHERLRLYKNEKLELGRIISEDSKTVDDIDKRYVELGARRKILKMELDLQAMTTSKCQEQLDRLSMEFRKVYRHRQEMITLWSTNIENAKRKDAQMQDVADDYFETREKMRDLKSEMEFRERQYKSVQCGIRHCQLQISDLDKKSGEVRRAFQLAKEMGRQLNDAILEMQQDIRSSSAEERNLQARSAKLDSEVGGLQEKMDKFMGAVEKLRSKLQEVKSLRYNSDQNITELEKILLEEEKKSDAVMREMELTRKFFWERSNDKKTLTSEIVHFEMSIHRLKSSFVSLEAKEYSNLEFLAKQSAKVYRMDLECSTLENKLSRAENESINPQYYMVQSEISQLREGAKSLSEERKYISKELSQLEHLISKNGSELAKNREEKGKLNTELLEINMVSQRTQKLIDLTDKNYQDMQVENSLESVNLKRLNDAMKLAKEQLYGLSEERKTIHWAVNERKAEIENNRTLNVNKSKALLEAVNRLKVQIQEMDGRTDKLKGRFVLVTKLMTDSQSAGATDEETIAHKVRKAARERESLQLEFRKWEQRVEEAKQELMGLENVQKLMHSSNVAVKEKLCPIKDGSMESEELELLEQEEKGIHVRKRRAHRFKLVLFDKIEDLKQQMAVMEQETQATAQLCKMKAAMASRIENELNRGKEKVQRWSSICCKVLKEVKPILNKDDYDILQRDLRLKFILEKMECALNMLDRLLTAFPDRMHMVVEFFEGDQNLSPLSVRIRRSVAEKLTSVQKAVRRRTHSSRPESQSRLSSANEVGRFSISNKHQTQKSGGFGGDASGVSGTDGVSGVSRGLTPIDILTRLGLTEGSEGSDPYHGSVLSGTDDDTTSSASTTR